jgi:hypothetical protein
MQVTGGICCLSGTAVEGHEMWPWSLVLKIAQYPADAVAPSDNAVNSN